jgi:hypothetical protein
VARHPPSPKVGVLIGCAAILAAQPVARAEDSEDITAVSARVSSAYVRENLPDGSVAPESYAFGEGGRLAGTVSDASISRMRFVDVARVIAGPLRKRGYVPSRDTRGTKLLIVVYWGRTLTPLESSGSPETQNLQDANARLGDAKSENAQQDVAAESMKYGSGPGMVCGHFDSNPTVAQVDSQIDADNALSGALSMVAAQDRMRDQVDARNAGVLGFDALWSEASTYRGTPLEFRRRDLVDEIEESRYFVVLMAYDFQAMWKQKQHRLLWETRFSIRQRHHDFGDALTAMSETASFYFGSDSHGVARIAVPEGRVHLGELRTMGTVAGP